MNSLSLPVSRPLRAVLALLLLAGWGPVSSAAEPELVLSAPPRESRAEGELTYAPIARYLSANLGIPVVYRHSLDWVNYTDSLARDAYDLVFDGPHFVSWRISHHGHRPLVRLSGEMSFVVIVRADEEGVTKLADLAGHSLCTHAPPNLATLTVMAQFRNFVREPWIREMRGFHNIITAVEDGRCVGGVIPTRLYRELGSGDSAPAVRTLFMSPPVTQQGFSASRRVDRALQQRIRELLLAPGGQDATRHLRARFGSDRPLQTATLAEYRGLDTLLAGYWGLQVAQP
ncbi:MAG: phosphate/phosphite/phosphonate ABC transporter substrate-binding protein [Gammaproteobacteria bacterium]|jgi:ABC-type phosphate/phosphonate transport system substrate-binding protein|nr:phosphate/phosphite/phosphonate ABC transporter substrate-binding protein [Gammaproteobacteria bacterium]